MRVFILGLFIASFGCSGSSDPVPADTGAIDTTDALDAITEAGDGADQPVGTDANDGTDTDEGTECDDQTLVDCFVCGSELGYDPALLDAATAEHLASVDDPVDCGCLVHTNVAADPKNDTKSACLCDAFGACTEAHLRMVLQSVEGDPIGQELIVRQTAAGCELIQLTDMSQDAFAFTDEVAAATCASLVCDGRIGSQPWGQDCSEM